MDKFLNANIIISKFCNEFNDLKKELPIRPSEMGVLNIIVKRTGFFTPLMVAELLEVSKPLVSTYVSALEKKGYITRKPLKTDKRSFYILPTKKAEELVEVTTKKMNANLTTLEDSLGKENFSILVDLLEKAQTKLKEIKGE